MPGGPDRGGLLDALDGFGDVHDQRHPPVAQDRRAGQAGDIAQQCPQGLDDDLLLPDQRVDAQADLLLAQPITTT